MVDVQSYEMKWVGIVILLIGIAGLTSSLWSTINNYIVLRQNTFNIDSGDKLYRLVLFSTFIAFGAFMHIYGRMRPKQN